MSSDDRNSETSAAIRVGIGGWTFAPWRGAFYPKGVPHAQELAYASTHLTSIEINGTFYRTQTPATFQKWAQETPDGFVFSVKGPRYVTQRHTLKEAGDSMRRFFDSGVAELHDRGVRTVRSCGSSPRPKSSTKRISAAFSNSFRASGRDARCAMSSKCVTPVSARPHSSLCCAPSTRRSSSPSIRPIP